MLLGITSSQRRKRGQPPVIPPAAQAGTIAIPGSIAVDDEIDGTYVYSGTANEQNIPPSIDDCFITGDMVVGETITFNVTNHRVYNDGVAAPTVFRLYTSTNMKQGSEALIYTGTATTYVILFAELSKRLRLEADPKQTGGANLTGATVKSAYTDIITAAP
jgi:hypothetical protein